MTFRELQSYLRETGRYAGKIDGVYGPVSRAAILKLFEDGPDTKLTDADLAASAKRLGVSLAQVKAVTIVEAAGAGFEAGMPLILPEPHRFSRNTQHRFDVAYPILSYPTWGTRPYPKSQALRYAMLADMIALDPDAGFASASYGKFQIMGENYEACGFKSSMEFAVAMSRDEKSQLAAFEAFLKANHLVAKLKACTSDPATCEPFCAGYNGSAFRANGYHIKLAAQIAKN